MTVDAFLKQVQEADLLRFTTAGSVDDGKSTLIGRLLHDAKSIYEDHLASLHKDSIKAGREEIDFALLTDGLKAEREQGITIDVAYRHFSTPKRRFIIADTPGHEQYTRNMVTGASTANLAVILIDAQNGVVTQSKRHGFIASLLGIPHLVVAVNKMDLVGYSQEVFDDICEEYTEFSAKLPASDLIFIPMSALEGDNVVERSARMPWYDGPPLLSHLETVHIASDQNLIDFRFPVQYVLRPHGASAATAGRWRRASCGSATRSSCCRRARRRGSSGSSRVRGRRARLPAAVGRRSAWRTRSTSAAGTCSPTRRTCRGSAHELEAMLIWMDDGAAQARDRQYVIKHTTSTVRGRFSELQVPDRPEHAAPPARRDPGPQRDRPRRMQLFRPIFCDEYQRNRQTGSFIVIDPHDATSPSARGWSSTAPTATSRSVESRKGTSPATSATSPPTTARRVLGQKPVTLWLTGLSGSGKSTSPTRWRSG